MRRCDDVIAAHFNLLHNVRQFFSPVQVCSHFDKTGSYPEELKEQVQKALQILEFLDEIRTAVWAKFFL